MRCKTRFLTVVLMVLTSVCGQARAQTLTTLFNFDSAHGSFPDGDLTLSEDGSALYGMARYGGTNGRGTIFSEPVGGGVPAVLFNFDSTHGNYPQGSLTLNGSTLYGMAATGGVNRDGTIFSEPVGGGTPTVLYNFDMTHGYEPRAV